MSLFFYGLLYSILSEFGGKGEKSVGEWVNIKDT
jgi:hypothetical protein